MLTLSPVHVIRTSMDALRLVLGEKPPFDSQMTWQYTDIWKPSAKLSDRGHLLERKHTVGIRMKTE